MILLSLTRIANYTVLALALWLGLYLVTRNPRRLVAWLTALTLWSVASLSLSVLLSLDPPPEMGELPFWLKIFLPVWDKPQVERAAANWLNGWSITPAIVLWHHITVLIRPGPITPWRWARVILGYLLLVVGIYLHTNTPHLFTLINHDILYMPTIIPGRYYWLFLLASLTLGGLSLANLIRSAQAAPTSMPRKQYHILIAATLVGALAGFFSVAGSLLGAQIPIVVLTFLMGGAVVLLGAGVANYGTLVEGRTIRHDFIYNAVVVAGIALLYLSVTWFSVVAYRVPAVAYIYIFILAIITHSLVDVIRRALDSFFFRQDTRRLRADLQRLTTLAGEQNSLDTRLSLTLYTLCQSVRATYGLVVLFAGDGVRLSAGRSVPRGKLTLTQADLLADDITPLDPGHFGPPLSEAALLIPLYADTQQVGALLLGRPVNGISYSPEDIDFLLYPSDRIADAIAVADREAEYMRQLTHLVARDEQQAVQTSEVEEIPVKAVEKAFRRLSDFAQLGENPLASLKLVSDCFQDEAVTHLDRGKMVHQILLSALEKLRPDEAQPGRPPTREWYPYLILHRAYVEDIDNRDIMQRLYISEGTFNRTRRAALRAVTRTLTEMEIETRAGQSPEPNKEVRSRK